MFVIVLFGGLTVTVDGVIFTIGGVKITTMGSEQKLAEWGPSVVTFSPSLDVDRRARVTSLCLPFSGQ